MLGVGIKEYLYPWQLPLLALLVFGWLMLGGYFLSKGLQQNGASKKVTFGICALATFLISAVSGAIAVVVYKAGMKFSMYPISIPGFIAAVAVYCSLFILVVHTWQKKMTFSQTFKSTWPSLVATLVLAAVILTPTGIISWKLRQKDVAIGYQIRDTQIALLEIFKALQAYGPDRPPETLKVLVSAKQLTPQQLKSPVNPEREVGFIYAPADIRLLGDNENKSQTIIASDYMDTFKGFRVMLYADGTTSQAHERTFRDVVALPCNKSFRKAVKEAEGLEIEEEKDETAEEKENTSAGTEF